MKYLPLILLIACSSQPYTWGDVTDELAGDYCATLAQCGFRAALDREVCIEHTTFHLCRADRSCNRPVRVDDAEAALAACANSLGAYEFGSFECIKLGYGLVSAECSDVLDLKPEQP